MSYLFASIYTVNTQVLRIAGAATATVPNFGKLCLISQRGLASVLCWLQFDEYVICPFICPSQSECGVESQELPGRHRADRCRATKVIRVLETSACSGRGRCWDVIVRTFSQRQLINTCTVQNFWHNLFTYFIGTSWCLLATLRCADHCRAWWTYLFCPAAPQIYIRVVARAWLASGCTG